MGDLYVKVLWWNAQEGMIITWYKGEGMILGQVEGEWERMNSYKIKRVWDLYVKVLW